jgi:hypothetical protein
MGATRYNVGRKCAFIADVVPLPRAAALLARASRLPCARFLRNLRKGATAGQVGQTSVPVPSHASHIMSGTHAIHLATLKPVSIPFVQEDWIVRGAIR